MALSSFDIMCVGFDTNYDSTNDPDVDSKVAITFEVVPQVTLDDTRVEFCYGDEPSANCAVAKGIAITPWGGIFAGKEGITAMLGSSTSAGVTTAGLPLYAKIGDTMYVSAPYEASETSHINPLSFSPDMVGKVFTMSPVS